MSRRIEFIASSATHDLRLRVLRKGTPSQDVTYPQDDLPGTVHLGVLVRADELLGVASWAIERWPSEPNTPAVRLRGMAVEPSQQGTGLGVQLVAAGVDWARAQGAELVWASTRDAVEGFYARCGFVVMGDGFIDAPTALPHHVMIRRLPGGE